MWLVQNSGPKAELSALDKRWSILRMAAGLQGGGGSGRSHSGAKREHAPQGLDWQELWTQDVRSGEDWLVSEHHSLPEPLNPLRPKSPKRVGYHSLPLPRAFSSLWHKTKHANTYIIYTVIDTKGKQFSK